MMINGPQIAAKQLGSKNFKTINLVILLHPNIYFIKEKNQIREGNICITFFHFNLKEKDQTIDNCI